MRRRSLNTPFRRQQTGEADQQMVNRLTNYQRVLWARAGYPQDDSSIQQWIDYKPHRLEARPMVGFLAGLTDEQRTKVMRGH